MENSITVRHCEVTDELRERAVAAMERLANHSPHALDGAVVFSQGADGAEVELRLHVRGGQILVGLGQGTDHRSALDRAAEKLGRQLERASSRRKKRRPSSSS